MNKILSFFLLFGLIPFTNAQMIKINQMESYFNYNLNEVNIQIEQSGENGRVKMSLIQKRKNDNDSIVLMKINLNQYYQIIDSFLIYDRLGRKLIEGFYSDSIHRPRQKVITYYSFYNLMGTPHGKFTFYDYESDKKNAKRFYHSVENYFYGTKDGEFIEYFSEIEQIETISHYKNNLLEGEYILYHSNGSFKQKGFYKNNLKNGAWTTFRDNNQPSKYEQYQDGKKHGQYKEWFENGNVSVLTNYQDGLIHSFYHSYYPNKKRKDSCTYNYGNLHGKMVSYYENGKKQKQGEYKDGSPIGDYKYWNEKGQLLQHFPYKLGFLNGTVLKYYPNGNLYEKYGMKNDTLNGDYSTFYEDGKVKSKANYKMGVIQKGALYFDSTGKKMNFSEEFNNEEKLMDENQNIMSVEQEQIELSENEFIVENYVVKLVEPFTKDDLKVWKKIKGKETKVKIAKDGSFELIFVKEDFNPNMILKAREVITKHLLVKPYKLNGNPIACTVTALLE